MSRTALAQISWRLGVTGNDKNMFFAATTATSAGKGVLTNPKRKHELQRKDCLIDCQRNQERPRGRLGGPGHLEETARGGLPSGSIELPGNPSSHLRFEAALFRAPGANASKEALEPSSRSHLKMA